MSNGQNEGSDLNYRCAYLNRIRMPDFDERKIKSNVQFKN